MAVDYDAIREENVKRYGWDTAVLDLLGQLYSQRTHFLFELIQNAEDAGARELTFQLFDDRLVVRHDGRPFNEDDVRGICGVGKSTKSEDLTQIGKFGIGFKSVYAYTRTPSVHSGGEHFRIESYVRPLATEPVDLSADETRFIFPFDRTDVPAREAVEEIATALDNLGLGTLLFLRNIQQVQIRGEIAAAGTMERLEEPRGPSSRHVILRSSLDGTEDVEEWFVWNRPLDALGKPLHRVEVAFRVREHDGSYELYEQKESPLVVFFPTAKETFLGFLVQGPYRTTPARDNIPEYDEWNRSLAAETAKLVATVLRKLRDEQLLTVEVLQAMPLDATRFPAGSMLRPLFEAVRASLSNEQLIPSTDGGYRPARELKLARGSGLRELLDEGQLGRLYGEASGRAFVHESITPDRSPEFYLYLRQELGIDEVTPEAVVVRAERDFLTDQSDSWIARFYGFLHANTALWRAPRWQSDQPGPARSRPIVRLENGTQVIPFDNRGLPRAYLPGSSPTDFPTVRRAIAVEPAARQFLEALKFTEPDIVAEVLEKVLPRYLKADATQLDAAQHQADLERIARALHEASGERRGRLCAQLMTTAFVVGTNAATGEQRLRTPPSLYQHTRELDAYLAGNRDAWFVDDGYETMLGELRELGLQTAPRVRARGSDDLGYVVTVKSWGRHERGVDGFDPAAKIDGLDHALRYPTEARSRYVWNVILAPNRHLLAGIVEWSTRQDFSGASREERRSPVGVTATSAAWLPGPDFTFHRPAELQLEDLPEGYKRDVILAQALGMEQPVVEEASKQLGLPPDLLRGLSANPDLVAKIQAELSARANPGARDDSDEQFEPETGQEDIAVLNFAAELTKAFYRTDHARGPDGQVMPADPSSDVRNPERRRELVRDAIEGTKASEPDTAQRFHHVSRRVWEAKDNAVRHFLLEQYDGHCQICSDTFEMRNGTPYFEGVYLVSRVRGRWVDRSGNVLCLCASCSAKLRYAPVEANDILDQVLSWRTRQEGGSGSLVSLRLCGQEVALRFTEKHLLDLQEIILSDTDKVAE